jgi:hypothetical protein
MRASEVVRTCSVERPTDFGAAFFRRAAGFFLATRAQSFVVSLAQVS